MAHTTRPFTTGLALAGAAAICAAAPAVVPGELAGLPSVSTAQYRLAAKIQVPNLYVVSQVGYGEILGPDDPYYPGQFDNDVKVTGPAGVAYYVADTILRDPYNLENYFFEVGAKSSNPIAGGLAAVAYVQTAALFGVDSLLTQSVKAAVTGGSVGATIGSAISAAVTALVYKIPVFGPIVSVYSTGTAPGGSTVYGTGINGVLAYVVERVPALGFLIGPPRGAAAVSRSVDGLLDQAVKASATGGNLGATIGSAISALAASLLYKIPVLGPIASVYITGTAPGDPTVYGTGINGVLAYAVKRVPALGFLIGPPRGAAAVAPNTTASVVVADAAQPATTEAPEPARVISPASRVGGVVGPAKRARAAAKLTGAGSGSTRAAAPATEAPETAAAETSDAPAPAAAAAPRRIAARIQGAVKSAQAAHAAKRAKAGRTG